MKRIFGLDILRAIAICCVVISHGAEGFFEASYVDKPAAFLGYYGVELFFVLSGFLIGGILIRDFNNYQGFSTIKHFWLMRWYRTLPNFYFFLFINFSLNYFLKLSHDSWWSYAFFIQNFTDRAPELFGESWSLAIEEWFYLLFPIVLFVSHYFTKSWQKSFVITMVFMSSFSILLRCYAFLTIENLKWSKDIRKVVIYRFDALMIGILGAYLKHYHIVIWQKITKRANLIGSLLFISAISIYFFMDLKSFVPGVFIFVVASFSAFFFLAGLYQNKEASGLLPLCVQKISLWSYSLYLTNVPVKLSLLHVGIKSGWLAFLLYLMLATGFAYIAYVCIERPGLRLRNRVLRN